MSCAVAHGVRIYRPIKNLVQTVLTTCLVVGVAIALNPHDPGERESQG